MTKDTRTALLVFTLLATLSASATPADPKPTSGLQGEFFVETRTDGEVTATVLTSTDKDAFLKTHNDARKALGLPPLEWSEDIARYSLQWIKHNHPACFDAAVADKPIPMRHRPHDGEFKQRYGENLAWWMSTGNIDSRANKAVTLWLSEKADFDKLNQKKPYVVGDEQLKTAAPSSTALASAPERQPPVVGHYTQIVWRTTTKVGAARWTFKSKDKTIVFIVANYDPPGNYLGQKPY